jgi:peroxiredoxin Q/BCP
MSLSCFVRFLVAALVVVPAAAGWLVADYVDPERPAYLRVGDRAPVFTCVDDQGKEWRSADHYGKKTILVCFYLGDFFKPCTEELCILRDARNRLAAEEVEIVAISGDKAANHELFKETYRLNFALLADEQGKVGRAFGVAMSGGGQQRIPHPKTKEEITLHRGATAARWSFLIGKDGRILHKDTSVNSKEQPRQILEFLAKQKSK